MVRASGAQLVSVNQNLDSFSAVLEGLTGMNRQVESMTEGMGVDVMRQSLGEALDEAAEHYTNVVEDKIHYEARMNQSLHSYLRHLYRGGDPANMGDKDKKLFMVNKRKITGSTGGWQTYISTLVDNEPSVSWITGSDRKLTTDANGNVVFSAEKYPVWRERAAFVYKKGGRATGASRQDNKYLTSAYPQPPEAGAVEPPESFTVYETFVENYSDNKTYFRKWWEEELKVSAYQMVDAFDASFRDGGRKTLYKLLQYAKTKETRIATGSVQTNKHTTFDSTAVRGALVPVGGKSQEVSTTMSKKISRTFYNEFVKALKRHQKRVVAMPSKPLPSEVRGKSRHPAPRREKHSDEYYLNKEV